MVEGLLVFLGLALLLYVVFGGADFGAGILELFCHSARRTEQRELTNRALGPVWEANHIWMIVVVVILFTGFPPVYQELSVTFHIPLTIMLFGIMLRGCAFTFRHYDPAPTDRQMDLYSRMFAWSSLFTPFAQGLIVGGLLEGRKAVDGAGFAGRFVLPWLSPFTIALGLFLCALYSFTASAFFIGEAETNDSARWCVARSKRAALSCIAFGGIVLLVAVTGDSNPLARFFTTGLSIGSMGVATVLMVGFLGLVNDRRVALARVVAGAVSVLVLAGWLGAEIAVLQGDGTGTLAALLAEPAPHQTITLLFWSLVAACALIFPALIWLYSVFKDVRRHPTRE